MERIAGSGLKKKGGLILMFMAALMLGRTAFANDLLISGWQTAFSDKSLTGASAMEFGANLILTGTAKDKSYGYVFQNFDLNMEEHPYLCVDVESSSGFWYIIMKNPAIKAGYVRVQMDTMQKGRQIYDLKAISGLSGQQVVELQLGVSSGKSDPNFGKETIIKELRFVTGKDGVIPGAKFMSGWQSKWPDGTDSGATVQAMDGETTVSGNSNKASYGAVYQTLTVDLDQSPYLTLNAVKTDGFWYVLAAGPALKDKVVKVQKDTNEAGVKSYNLKELLGLAGEQVLTLQVGISSGKTDPNLGKTFVFSGFAFVKEPAAASSEQPAVPAKK